MRLSKEIIQLSKDCQVVCLQETQVTFLNGPDQPAPIAAS